MNYFENETKCKCGCGYDINPAFLTLINKIREDYGKPITISSGARCKNYNTKIKGAKYSMHMLGYAVDFVRTDELLKFILANLTKYDIYIEDPKVTTTWIHIDTKKRPNRIFIP